MSAGKRIALFAAGLLAVFGVAAALGSAFDSAEPEDDSGHRAEHVAVAGEETEKKGEETEKKMETHTAHQAPDATPATHESAGGQATHEPAGLGISAGGYTLRMSPTQVDRGEARELRFSVDDAEGRPVTDYDELHERRMHLIVVRRDGTEFRHLHPEMDEAGTWSIPIEFAVPGVYRAFADFSTGGEQYTLASDVFVSGGEFEARPFPPAIPTYATNGYEVRLQAGEPAAGAPTSLSFAVSKDGHDVHDLAPYLGAKGHLVALREGDLAFLHVHPEEAGSGHGHGGEEHGHGEEGHGRGGAANEIAFAATFPTAGRYRLYLQFKHEGAVQTAQFTVAVPR